MSDGLPRTGAEGQEGRLVDGWIDVHAHFAPPRTEAQRAAIWSALQADNWVGCQPPEWTIEERLAYMDQVGIAMQMLSLVGPTPEAARAANAHGADMVRAHPTRFGLLAGLPTADADSALAELAHADELGADGVAVYCRYDGVALSDERLEPLWSTLDDRAAVVFVHPNHATPGEFDRPGVLMDVTYQTASVVTDMLYADVFRRHPSIRFVLAHGGGALPGLSGRLNLLGTQPWIPNPHGITSKDIVGQLAKLYLDTAMTGGDAGLAAALGMTPFEHIVYGSDCGAPCTQEDTAITNLRQLLASSHLPEGASRMIGRNALPLFPAAAERLHATLAT